MEVDSYILVVLLIILALFLSFAIGGNDETPAPLAAAGIVKFNTVLIIGGVGLAIGTIFLSEEVASTVGAKFLGPSVDYTIYMLLSVLISAIIWLVVGSFSGIPLSSTHSLFGSIIGVVIVYLFINPAVDPSQAFNWAKMISVFLSWIVSPLVGYIFSFILYKIIARIFFVKLKGLNQIEESEYYFSGALLVVVFLVSVYTGGNSAEALGIIYALYDQGNLNSGEYFFNLILLGLFAFLGIYIAGRFVIKNLAKQMTDARSSEGFILQMASLIILMVNTIIGLPISHSHVIVFCIIGLNAAQKKEVDYKGIGIMAIYWVGTLPIAAILGGFIYFLFSIGGFV
ncbi:MAG: inorganic phosphate transporter [archaeon]|nr:inorganic phosphate transporter [archaeon]